MFAPSTGDNRHKKNQPNDTTMNDTNTTLQNMSDHNITRTETTYGIKVIYCANAEVLGIHDIDSPLWTSDYDEMINEIEATMPYNAPDQHWTSEASANFRDWNGGKYYMMPRIFARIEKSTTGYYIDEDGDEMEAEAITESVHEEEAPESIQTTLTKMKALYRAWSDKIDEEPEQDTCEAFEQWQEANNAHHFEGSTRNLEKLINAIGYDSMDDFLNDNPGAQTAIIEFITSQENEEWTSGLLA